MARIVTCELCGSGHREDQKCPDCLKAHNDQARLNVLRDAQEFGAGWSRTLPDGTIEHIDMAKVYIKDKESSDECSECGAVVFARGAKCVACRCRRDLLDEVEMSEARLIYFCNLVNAGERQGGGREFARQIDAQFRSIKSALGRQSTVAQKEAGDA